MIDPIKCIAKVANRLNLNERIARQAMEIMHDAIEKEVGAGRDPIAAAVLYMSFMHNNIHQTTFPKRNN